MLPAWLWLMGAAGFTYVLTQGVITRNIRRIYPPLLCCPMCAGTWVGIATGLLWYFQARLPEAVKVIVHTGLIAFASSLAACVACIVLVTVGSWRKPDASEPDPSEPCQHKPKATKESESGQNA